MTEQEIKQKIKSGKKIDWFWICIHQDLSEEFIKEFQDKFDWVHVSCFQQLSEEFIREFKDKVSWIRISEYQNLSEDFIREFRGYVDWFLIFCFQQLSEEFIKEFKEYVDWNNISKYQQLSEDFIREMKDYVDWSEISCYQNLSEEFLEEYKDYIDIDLYKEFHIEKPYYQKLEEVIDFCKLNNLYYNNEYFEAYREFGINNKELEKINYIQHYLPNIYYRNWRVNKNEEHITSFGYEVFPKKIYFSYKKVRIKIEDWGVKIKNGNYIRAKGFMII